MRLFPIHILVKDLSFLLFYFIIMKYDLTNETFLPETVRQFPGASNLEFSDMIVALIFYNWIPIIVSFILYYPIVILVRKLSNIKNLLQILITGFILSLTTPIIYIFGYKIDYIRMTNAELISWTLNIVLSVSLYFFLNKSKEKIYILTNFNKS